jgi:hypothetical protein
MSCNEYSPAKAILCGGTLGTTNNKLVQFNIDTLQWESPMNVSVKSGSELAVNVFICKLINDSFFPF